MQFFSIARILLLLLIVGAPLHAQLSQSQPRPWLADPQIVDFFPKNGPPGTSVVVIGQNLNMLTGIELNGTQAPIAQITPGQVVFQVPFGAESGPVIGNYGRRQLTVPVVFVVTQGPAPDQREQAFITFCRSQIDDDPDFLYLAVQQSPFPLPPGTTLEPVMGVGGQPSVPFVLPSEAYLFYVDEVTREDSETIGGPLFAHAVQYGLVAPGSPVVDFVFQEEWWPVVNGQEWWRGSFAWLSSTDLVYAAKTKKKPDKGSRKTQNPPYEELGGAGTLPEPTGTVRVLLLSGSDEGQDEDELDEAESAYTDRYPGAEVTKKGNQTKAEMCAALDKLKDDTQPGDTVIIHIAAHGSETHIQTKDDVANNDYMFHSDLAAKIKAISDKAGNTVVFLRACHAGALEDDLDSAGYKGTFIGSSAADQLTWFVCHFFGLFGYTNYFSEFFFGCLTVDPGSTTGKKVDTNNDGKIDPKEAHAWGVTELEDC